MRPNNAAFPASPHTTHTYTKVLALCHDMMEYRTVLRELCVEDSAAISEMRTDWTQAKHSLEERCDKLVVAVASLAASTEQYVRRGLRDTEDSMERKLNSATGRLAAEADELRYAANTRLTDLWEHVQGVGKQHVVDSMQRPEPRIQR